jgi:hypothetical protein
MVRLWTNFAKTGWVIPDVTSNYLRSIFVVHFFNIEKHCLVSMVFLLHFKKSFGIIYFNVGKVSHLAWHAVVFILPVLGVGWHYVSVEVPLLMSPLPFLRMTIDEWMWSILSNVDWHQTTLSTWRKSCRWAACHFNNFETGSEAHPAPSLIGFRGSSPGPKWAEA